MGSNKDDIKPINLKNEKDISAEFVKISSILENPSKKKRGNGKRKCPQKIDFEIKLKDSFILKALTGINGLML